MTDPTDPRPDFPIDAVLERIEAAIKAYPKAAMFELAERGHASLFAQLVGCIISIRTRDEVTLPCTLRLLERAPTPEAVAALTPEAMRALLADVQFTDDKARRIQAIARAAIEAHGGQLPCDAAVLQAFDGVGPKCAHLALSIACGEPRISVDTHVHRVTNRWGYVATRRPEQTLRALEAALPERWWTDINRLLVPFGKHICTWRAPRCSGCPARDACAQVGVTSAR